MKDEMMQRCNVLLVGMIITSIAIGMEVKTEFLFSSQENDCYEWFETQKERYAPDVWHNLSDKTKNALCGESTEDELRKGLKDFVDEVFKKLYEKTVLFSYDDDSVVSTLYEMHIAMRAGRVIKPTGKTTACMYTFIHLLTEAERATVQEKNYLENPQTTDKAMYHYGELLTGELVKLGLIEDTPQARESSILYLRYKKMNELSRAYNKKKIS